MNAIKTGIASFGLSGQVFHAPFIDVHEGFELTAVAERSRKAAQQKYPQIKSVDSFGELLQEDIELVIVNTPDATHYDFCKQAILAGKHVVVEKPFIFTEVQAEELICMAEKQGTLLTVYQNRRYDGDFLTLGKLLAEETLGRIVEFQSSFQRYRPQLVDNTWKEHSGGRVGITYNLCSHLCDQALVLFGKPERVWATLASQRDDSKIDDYCHMQLIYPDNLRVSLRAGMLIREEAARFALHGTKGSYVKFGLDPQENAMRYAGIRPEMIPWCPEEETNWGTLHTDAGRQHYPTITGNYMDYYDNIYRTLREGATAEVSHADMLADIRMLEAVFQSHTTGCTVKIR